MECLAVREVEVEVEFEPTQLQQQQQQQCGFFHEGGEGTGNAGYQQRRQRAGAGYYAWQEVEGVGGVMKGKRKVKLKVGGWVEAASMPAGGRRGVQPRDDDEALRNWCGWCERVVLEAGTETGAEAGAEAGGEGESQGESKGSGVGVGSDVTSAKP